MEHSSFFAWWIANVIGRIFFFPLQIIVALKSTYSEKLALGDQRV